MKLTAQPPHCRSNAAFRRWMCRVRNPSSEILNVICSPTSEKSNGSLNGHHHTPRRASQHVDSFSRLFGNSDKKKPTPRRGSLNNQDVTNRNPVTGSGVTSWDCRPASRNNTPKVHIERNPVTGEVYQIVSPVTTPTKPVQNGFAHQNGFSTPVQNGHSGHSTPMMNGNGNPTMNGNATPNGNA
nr:unnamed protein product [Callosobruchus chinensis]